MPDSNDASKSPEQLRLAAETLLRQGKAPITYGSTVSVDTLSLLHKFAISPDSAADALKLLHEFQVHQIELDLQQVQLRINEQEMIDTLAHYKSLYDFAPAAYLIINPEGDIVTTNLAGVELFGISRDLLCNRALASLFTTESRPAIHGLLQQLRDGDSYASCDQLIKLDNALDNNALENNTSIHNSKSNRLRISANLSMNGESAQLIISEYTIAPRT